MPSKVIEIMPQSRESVMGLIPAGDDSFKAKEQQEILLNTEKSMASKYKI